MTVQENAKELVDKFLDCMPTLMLKGDNLSLSIAKRCALICVNESLEAISQCSVVGGYPLEEYKQLKQEIENYANKTP